MAHSRSDVQWPLTVRLTEFEAYLQNKAVTPNQVQNIVSHVRKMMQTSTWAMTSDISAFSALDFLGGPREAGKNVPRASPRHFAAPKKSTEGKYPRQDSNL